MVYSIIFHIVQPLILLPLEAKISDNLGRANAPYEVIAQLNGCASSAMPLLIQRVSDDPWWGADTVIDVWVRGTAPERVLGDVGASCGSAIKAATPYLRASVAVGA
jgi:hypothetical protein